MDLKERSCTHSFKDSTYFISTNSCLTKNLMELFPLSFSCSAWVLYSFSFCPPCPNPDCLPVGSLALPVPVYSQLNLIGCSLSSLWLTHDSVHCPTNAGKHPGVAQCWQVGRGTFHLFTPQSNFSVSALLLFGTFHILFPLFLLKRCFLSHFRFLPPLFPQVLYLFPKL